jgi:chromosome segregation ATPase
MKTVVICVALTAALLLTGCANTELIAAQENSQALQQQLNQAKATIQQKDAEIATIKSENVQMQTTAMESITTMMNKEEERSKKLQASIAARDEEITQLQKNIEAMKAQLQQSENIIAMLRQKEADKAAAESASAESAAATEEEPVQ